MFHVKHVESAFQEAAWVISSFLIKTVREPKSSIQRKLKSESHDANGSYPQNACLNVLPSIICMTKRL